MKNRIVLLTCLLATLGMIAVCSKQRARRELIPLETLFGNPEKASARISPDGTYISYLAPVNNVLNVFIAQTHKTKGLVNPQQMTFDTDRGIRSYFWSPDGSKILYVQDKGGDENWWLYGVDRATKNVVCYTPFDNVQVHVLAVDKHHPDFILIGMNKENPQEHDVYKLFLENGQLELVLKNPGKVIDTLVDKDMVVKGICKTLDNGGRQFLVRDAQGNWQPVVTWDADDALTSEPLKFDGDPNFVYLRDSRNADTARLVKLDVATGAIDVLVEDQCFDVGAVFFDEDTDKPLAAEINKEQSEWVMLDQDFAKDFQAMRDLDEGELHLINTDNEKKKYVIGFEKDNGPFAYYLYDSQDKTGVFLFYSRSDLVNYQLASMKPVSFVSRDGFTIHGYLTVPVDKEPKNLPLVLVVHGGPWSRDSWGYRSEAQWLANRGFAVLQVNFRGSKGFGKTFLNAGNKEWGGKMHNDLIDGVNWTVTQGVAHPKKIAIYGGSYGGYAALVGATFTPDVFCCAVDVVGISNLTTFMKSIPPYWEAFRQEINRRVGNMETEEEFLRSRSPLFFVDNIKIPMLIAQGANDPRVKQAESEQIVAALQEKGLDYQYLLFSDEGHGFVKPRNRLKFYQEAEKFLAKHLGGRES